MNSAVRQMMAFHEWRGLPMEQAAEILAKRVGWEGNGAGPIWAIMEESFARTEVRRDQLDQEVVMDAVCRTWSVTKEELMSRRRTDNIVEPRHACYAALTEQDMTQNEIARVMGLRDHGTISWGVKSFHQRLKQNKRTAILWQLLRKELHLP